MAKGTKKSAVKKPVQPKTEKVKVLGVKEKVEKPATSRSVIRV